MRNRTEAYYRGLWETVAPLPEWQQKIDVEVTAIRALRLAYQKALIAAGFPCLNWRYIAAIHHMEADCDFRRQLLNGERWDRKTTLTPAGLGPWPSFEAALKFAIAGDVGPSRVLIKAILAAKDAPWTVLDEIEAWNGMGYAMRGKNSAYLWSGSNHGIGAGIFVETIENGRPVSRYRSYGFSGQVGAALVLKRLWEVE